jgi:isopenicillin N synthase-like dioxygenase
MLDFFTVRTAPTLLIVIALIRKLLPVTGHGIPLSVISGAFTAAKNFFALSEPVKLEVRIASTSHNMAGSMIFQLDIHKSKNFKGYTALLGENTNPENRGDLHEGFDLGWEDSSSGTVRSSEDDGSMAGENVWPDEALLPGFRRAVLQY